ncbi:MAG: hypothetical protein KF791_01575 [Verrucomicrobiae bacterium]|nr:hypothetical protein [Verrucomicrobiae bacterium]
MTESEFLLLPDGRVLANNLTPALAAVLAGLNPQDAPLAARAAAAGLHAPPPIPGPAAMTPLETRH